VGTGAGTRAAVKRVRVQQVFSKKKTDRLFSNPYPFTRPRIQIPRVPDTGTDCTRRVLTNLYFHPIQQPQLQESYMHLVLLYFCRPVVITHVLSCVSFGECQVFKTGLTFLDFSPPRRRLASARCQ
jgi:hypothetical protein